MISIEHFMLSNVVLNIFITGILATVLTNLFFFVIFRIFQYDYVFLDEAGALFTDESQSVSGFITHIFLGILICAIYALPYLLLLSILSNNSLGIYRFDPNQGTAVVENMQYFFPLFILYFLFWWLISFKSKTENQKSLLLIYSLVFSLIAGLIFGLYGMGLIKPGIIY